MPLFRRGESASTLDLLVVGLGNPGREHARDRHNVGFMVVDELARRHDGIVQRQVQRPHRRDPDRRPPARRCSKPDTYMNDSGRSVQPAVAFYKAPLDSLLVVHDEVDLDVGRLQARLGGGLAGHNGLRSIAGRLGSPEFLRLRVGVGRPGPRRPARRRRLRARRRSRPRRTRPRSSRVRRTPSSRSSPSVSTRRSAPSTERAAPCAADSCGAPADRRRPRRRRGGTNSLDVGADLSGQWKPVAPGTQTAQPVTRSR